MSLEFNSSLIQQAFGMYGRFPVYYLDAPPENEEQYYTSAVTGAKVWDRITLKNPEKDHLNYIDEKGKAVVMPSFTFPDPVLIECTLGKDIIRTKVAGANGQVKEEISLNDWQITIRGLIINYKNDDYPKIEAARLVGTFKRPLECGVVSKFINNVLKVNNLVFGELQLKSFPGHGNVQAFEITAESDEPVVFQLLKK